ncbi:MAG: helix-hairpin-helix domain-containing protein [Bacteroidetes bacterium]|jgi:DNA uptake protein ComE-like DNA-binding protein|nr:helix-hairpin-helix domain-containing protein [Bacteroidota bacterium]
MRSIIKNYLSITKKEWNGMVVLVILIALVLAAPYLLQLCRKDTTINPADFNKAVAVLNQARKSQGDDDKTNAVPVYKKAADGVVIELNSADSAKLTELKGIGPSFARRIVNYRNRLGGFISKEQLKELFGMDDDRYAEIQAQVSVDPSHIQKIHINKVDFDGLKYFPYLTFKQMNAIVQFREQHGDYASLSDMRNIVILNDEILRKIEPYIDFK